MIHALDSAIDTVLDTFTSCRETSIDTMKGQMRGAIHHARVNTQALQQIASRGVGTMGTCGKRWARRGSDSASAAALHLGSRRASDSMVSRRSIDAIAGDARREIRRSRSDVPASASYYAARSNLSE